MNTRRRQRSRQNQLSKSGLKNENIDRQIRVLHQAMAEKMLHQPNLVQIVADKILERYEQGKMYYGAYLTWTSILEHFGNPDVFLQALLEDSPRMRKLRRKTPFVGILTEQERESALLKFACGDADINSLL